MRKSGIITLLVILLIILGISYLLTDAWLEGQIENAASTLNGAKVEIDGFDFSLFQPGVKWDRLQVTNPRNTMKNTVETGFSQLDLEFWPLLSGKIIVENFEISEVRSGTERETDGALPQEEKEKHEQVETFVGDVRERVDKESKSIPAFKLAGAIKSVNVDSIVKVLNLSTPQKADSLKNALSQNYTDISNRIQQFDFDKEAQKIESQIKSIDVNKVKDVESFNKTLSAVKSVNSNIDSLTNSFNKTKKTIQNDISATSSAVSQIDEWVKNDYQKALSVAKLPDFSAENMARILFGEQILGHFYQYLGYVQTGREYAAMASSGNDKEPSPPRLEGQDIYFPSENPRPDLWIRRIALSGMLNEEMPLSGQVTDISDNPPMIGKPIKIDIDGSSQNRSYGLEGTIDYTTDKPSENIQVRYDGMPLKDFKLADADYLPTRIASATSNIAVNFTMQEKNINANITMNASKVNYAFKTEKPANKVEQIVRDVFNQTKDLQVKTVLKGDKDNLSLELRSNLDKKLADAFRATASKEIEQAKAKLRAEVNKQVEAKKQELQKFVNEQKEKIEQQIAKYQAMIDEKKDLLDKKKKELNDQKKKYENQLKDKLKDIFKP